MSDPGRRQGAEPDNSPVGGSPSLAHAQTITAPLEEEMSNAGARWVLDFDASLRKLPHRRTRDRAGV
jgi:hypothetical protein